MNERETHFLMLRGADDRGRCSLRGSYPNHKLAVKAGARLLSSAHEVNTHLTVHTMDGSVIATVTR